MHFWCARTPRWSPDSHRTITVRSPPAAPPRPNRHRTVTGQSPCSALLPRDGHREVTAQSLHGHRQSGVQVVVFSNTCFEFPFLLDLRFLPPSVLSPVFRYLFFICPLVNLVLYASANRLPSVVCCHSRITPTTDTHALFIYKILCVFNACAVLSHTKYLV